MNTDRQVQEHATEVEALYRRVAELEGLLDEREKTEARLRRGIPGRIRVDEETGNSDEPWKVLFEHAPNACYLYDLKGTIVDGNRAAEEMTGYERDELIGRHFLELDLLPARQIPAAARLLARNAFAEPTGPDEFALNRKDGKRVVAETRTYPVEVCGKKLVLGIARDITGSKQSEAELEEYRNHPETTLSHRKPDTDIAEREHVEKALQASEEKLRLIVEAVAEGIVVVDLNGRILQVNKAVAELRGRSTREELVGRDIFDFIADNDRTKVLDDLKTVAEGGQVRSAQYRALTTDGQALDVEVGAGLLRDGSGAPFGLVASIRDISDSKRAEAELRAHRELIDSILATMPNAVLVLRRDSSVVLANQAFHECFQMEKGTVENRPLDQLVPDKSLSRAVLAVVEGREHHAKLQFKYRVAGRDRTMVANVFPMREQQVLLVVNDVTEEQLRQEKMLATDRLASVGEMVAGIAHELNNPLTSIVSLAELLVEEDLPDEINADFQDIYKETMRAARIVRKLLTFSRRSSGAERLPVQVNEVVHDVLRLRAYEHRVNNIKVETHLAPDLPEVTVDNHEIQQLFLNIILNAESAMIEAHSSGVLTIASERVGGMVRVSFADDGPGIPEENLSRVFDPFFTTKEVGEGTGLGLSICRGIVKEHGGKVSVESGVGKGATFTVELPVLGS